MIKVHSPLENIKGKREALYEPAADAKCSCCHLVADGLITMLGILSAVPRKSISNPFFQLCCHVGSIHHYRFGSTTKPICSHFVCQSPPANPLCNGHSGVHCIGGVRFILDSQVLQKLILKPKNEIPH